mmetsp:Transcript_118248/g.335365  ORF Transcript_118248/g.335365 Transcript_118248/m.335365 type:complete len:207 (-) Transcript_118248:70-690(-)
MASQLIFDSHRQAADAEMTTLALGARTGRRPARIACKAMTSAAKAWSRASREKRCSSGVARTEPRTRTPICCPRPRASMHMSLHHSTTLPGLEKSTVWGVMAQACGSCRSNPVVFQSLRLEELTRWIASAPWRAMLDATDSEMPPKLPTMTAVVFSNSDALIGKVLRIHMPRKSNRLQTTPTTDSFVRKTYAATRSKPAHTSFAAK